MYLEVFDIKKAEFNVIDYINTGCDFLCFSYRWPTAKCRERTQYYGIKVVKTD